MTSLAAKIKVDIANLELFEHTFTHWVVLTYQKSERDLPAIDALADRVFPYVEEAVDIALSFEAPAVVAIANPILERIKASFDTASGLITDFGATPNAQGIVTAVQSDLAGLEAVAGIKSDAAKNAIAKALSSTQAFIAAFAGAVTAAKNQAAAIAQQASQAVETSVPESEPLPTPAV